MVFGVFSGHLMESSPASHFLNESSTQIVTIVNESIALPVSESLPVQSPHYEIDVRRSERLSGRHGSRNTVDDIIEQVIKNSTMLVEQAQSQPRRSQRSKKKRVQRTNLDVSDGDEVGELGQPENMSSNESVDGWICPICGTMVKYLKNKGRHILDYHGIRLSSGTFRRNRIRCLRCQTVCLNGWNFSLHHSLKHKDLTTKFKPITQTSKDRKLWSN